MEKYKNLIYRAINKPHFYNCRQEAYAVAVLSFFEAKRSYDPSYGVPFIAYLVGKLDGDLHTFARRRYRALQREVSLSTPYTEQSEEDCTLADTLAANTATDDMIADKLDLQQALTHLTPLQRKIIDLTVHAGLTQWQAAQRLGISQQAVSHNRQRAFAILRCALC